VNIEHSRALRLAATVTGLDEPTLRARQEQALVFVSLDPTLAGVPLAARTLLSTLRRLPGRLALGSTGLPSSFVDEVVATTLAIDPSRPLALDQGESEATVRVHLGLEDRAGAIRVVPDGFGAQLAGDPEVEVSLGRPGNALGAIFAAALAAAEVFKYVVVDNPDRRTLHRHLSFCPLTLTNDTTTAPELRITPNPIDAAIVGNGAVGTAIALILAELRLGGRLILCDHERYGPENRGTYSLGGELEARTNPLKVELVGEILRTAGYSTIDLAEKSTAMIERIDAGEIAVPPIVLTGLDSVEARRETQMLFPDHIFDAATGDTALGLHHAVPAGPCLRCFFTQNASGPDPLVLLAEETGLPLGRLRRGDEALSDQDLAGLTAAQREVLEEFLGKPVCGLADAIGLTSASVDDYRPSVPFVSQLAACLAVGRLLAIRAGLEPEVNFFQFDALHGPVGNGGEMRGPEPECFCQQRRSIVRQLRLKRGLSS
jgi:hypothetical protein